MDRTTGSKGNNMHDKLSDMFHPITRVTLPYHPKNIQGATTQSQCAQACLTDCSCTAFSYNSSICSVWHGELLDVKLNDGTDNTSKMFFTFALPPESQQSLGKPKQKKPIFVAAASIATFGSLLILVMLMVIVWRNKCKLWCGGSQGIGGVIAFRYTDLDRATKSISERLRGGGFGSVFKGVLSDSTNIAVKRLDGVRQGQKQLD
jgi:hypothetical protein